MPRLRHSSLDAALVLLLGLSLPLAVAPTVAAANTPAPGPAKQSPAPGTGQQGLNGPAPEPALPSPLEGPPPSPASERSTDPSMDGSGASAAWEPKLEQLEDQLKQQQAFELLQPPRSLLQILALVSLPLSILALALALLQAQRNRREQQTIRQRLKELRQELNAREIPAPTPISLASQRLNEALNPVPARPEARPFPSLEGEAIVSDPPVIRTPAPAPSPVAVPSELPPAPVPASIDDWIAAVNSGQRDGLRSQAAIQLNITQASEDAIQMGRSDATCLEEVAAGGSYLRVSCGQEHWLLPTERTLASFRSFQPAKGLFSYEPMLSGDPQVQRACRIEASSSGWRVVTPGVIRVAG